MNRKAFRILVLWILLMVCVSAQNPALGQITPQEQVYFEDFEDSSAQGWDLNPSWDIINDNGNLVLSGQEHTWAHSNQAFEDYHLSFRVKLLKGEIHLVFQMNDTGRYFINFNAGESRLNKQFWPDHLINDLRSTTVAHPYHDWNQIEIIKQGEAITFIANGVTEWVYEDPEPLQFGSFSFETLEGSHAYFDEVRVSIEPISQPVESLADNELTWVRTGGPLGGLGYDVRMDPMNLDKMFVTDAYAGIFVSLDAGKSWFPSNEGIETRIGTTGDVIPIFSVTIDPNNSDIVWAGFQNDRGIYKSTDGGSTWQMKVNGIVERHGISFRGFTVEPVNSDVVYAAAEISSWSDGRAEKQGREFDMTQGVVYQSIDGGEHWQAIWRGENLARYIWVDPRNTDVLYISTGIFDREAYNSDPETWQPGGEGILKSIDGGKTWTQINHGLNNLYVGSLFMHPTDPDILLAGTGNNQYYLDSGAYLTTDGGATWEHVLSDDNITSVEISEADPSIAYAGSASTVYRSNDGGKTWSIVAGGDENGWGSPGVRAGFPIDFQVDPRDTNRIFSNQYGGGNFLSTDGGKSWMDASRGYTGAEMRAITVASNEPGLVLAAARSGVFISYDGGMTWEGLCYPPVVSMEWNTAKFDPRDKNTIIAGSNWGNVLAKSQNSGQTWTIVERTVETSNVGWREIAFSPSDPDIVYGGTAGYYSAGSFSNAYPGQGIFVSTNGGDTWKQANDALSQDAHVTALAVHPNHPQTVFAATANHGLLYTQDGGQSWQVIGGGLPSTNAASVAISLTDPQIIFAGFFNQAIYKSTDGGQTWSHSASGMPAEASIESIVFDPTKFNAVLYAADPFSGVYRSTNGGDSWQLINNGLTVRSVTKLAISDDGMHLYAAVNGGGVFRLDLSGEPPKPATKPMPDTPPAISPTPKLISTPATTIRELTSTQPAQVEAMAGDSTPLLIPLVGAGAIIGIALLVKLIVYLKKKR